MMNNGIHGVAVSSKFLFVVYASLLSTIGFFASDMYLPALDIIRSDFSTGAGNIALSLSIYMFGFAIAQLLYGSISDQVGRKRPLIFGMTLFILGNLGCIYAHTIEYFLFFRLVQAIGIGSAYVLWQPMVIDLFEGPESHKIFSFLIAIGSLSPVVAPLLGGVIAENLGWQMVFWILIVHTLVVLLWTIFFYKESLPQSRRSSFSATKILKDYMYFLGNGYFMGLNFAIACGLSLYLIFITLLPLIMANMGYRPDSIGLMFTFLAGAFILGVEVAKRLVTRIGSEKIILTGAIITFSGAGILFLLPWLFAINSAVILVGCFCIVTFGNGFLVPTGSAHLIGVFSRNAGSCASSMGFITSLLAVFSTTTASLMVEKFGIYAMTFPIICFSLLMLASLYLIRRSASEVVIPDLVSE